VTPPPTLPPLPSNPRRTLARAAISLVVALVVSIPALSAGVMDAGIIFVLSFGVTWGALLLVTNP